MARQRNRLRAAIDALPARPGLVIGCVLVVGVLAVYYYTTYSGCTHNARQRAALVAGVEAAAGSTLRIADIMTFPWTEIRIAQGFRPTGKVTSCPFGWDWSTEERVRLADAGQLTVIAFMNGGQPVDVIDVSGEDIRFEDVKKAYASDQAVFKVERGDGAARFVLTAVSAP